METRGKDGLTERGVAKAFRIWAREWPSQQRLTPDRVRFWAGYWDDLTGRLERRLVREGRRHG